MAHCRRVGIPVLENVLPRLFFPSETVVGGGGGQYDPVVGGGEVIRYEICIGGIFFTAWQVYLKTFSGPE